MERIISNLKRVNWKGREDRYRSSFKEVTFNNSIDNPVASVVIISWRLVDGLEKNLSLLHEQRDINYEIIFVNNGKDDAEFESIRKYTDTFVTLSHNTGAYVARNIGSLFAKAPIIIFLEDDGIIGDNFVKAHLKAFNKYDVISVRGICKPLTDNPLNKLARHYYLGQRAFPMAANLEGNSSYLAKAFFEVGGWNDDISFGHGGPELSYRLTKRYPDQRMQIYYPEPLIHHDYAKDEEHLKTKKEKQQASYQLLKAKYPDWEQFFGSWRKYYRKRYLIRKKTNNTFSEALSDGFSYLLYDVIKPVYQFVRGRR